MAKRTIKKIGVNEILGTNVLESGGKGGGMGLKFDFSSVKNWFKSKGLKAPESLKQVKARTNKAKLKIATKNKEARAPARKEGEAFRESRGTVRIEEVKPSVKDTPTVLRKDPRDTPAQQFAKEMNERQRLMSSTKASDVRKAMAPDKKIRDETRGFKSEFVGPGKRDIGGGKTQLWVDDADVIAATNKSPEKGFKKAQVKLSQEKDRLAGQNRHMIEHHQLVPDAVRQKKASRVQIKVTPPELRGLEKGTEIDIRGLQSSLKESGATVHGSTRSFTPEELASETTKTFKKRTKEYALKEKKSEDLKIGIVERHATGKKTPKVRAFPEKITMKEIGQGKVGEFKKKQALQIQRKEEGYKKASKTKAKKQKKSGKTQVKRDITNAQADRIANKVLGQQGVKEAEKWAKRASKRIPF